MKRVGVFFSVSSFTSVLLVYCIIYSSSSSTTVTVAPDEVDIPIPFPSLRAPKDSICRA